MIKEYVIKDNETLRDIAAKELGNPNLWVKIALMNNLSPPYIGTVVSKVLSSSITNHLLWSEDLSKSVWVASTGTTVTVNTELSPDKLLTADKVEGINVSEDIKQSITGLLGSQRYEPSFWIKKITGTGSTFYLKTTNGTGKWGINFAKLGVGWERITRDHPAVTVDNEFVTASAGELGFWLFATSLTYDFYIWGAQLELGDTTKSYVRTQGFSQKYVDEESITFVEGKVAKAGDVVIIPSDIEAENEKIYYTERIVTQKDYETVLLGVDIGLEDKKLVMIASHDGKDFFLKSGANNIEQAILHKFIVRKGGLYYHSAYGTTIMDYIGRTTDYRNIELVKAVCMKTVLQDPRVKGIGNMLVKVSDSNYDQIEVNINANLVGDIVSSIKIQVNPEGVAV